MPCLPAFNPVAIGTIVLLLGTDWLPLPPSEEAFGKLGFSERDMTIATKINPHPLNHPHRLTVVPFLDLGWTTLSMHKCPLAT